jgi:hypothetical protein
MARPCYHCFTARQAAYFPVHTVGKLAAIRAFTATLFAAEQLSFMIWGKFPTTLLTNTHVGTYLGSWGVVVRQFITYPLCTSPERYDKYVKIPRPAALHPEGAAYQPRNAQGDERDLSENRSGSLCS